MAVEGLAQAAVNRVDHENFYDACYFNSSNSDGGYTSSLTPPLSSISSNTKPQHTHAFTILERILKDGRLAVGKACAQDSQDQITDILNNEGKVIQEYASMWKTSEDEKEIQERVEELAWLVALMFGIGGWKNDRQFKADFYL
ncbi:hypothetical protein AG1IA_10283 [Rhizoctonia solani AG-1 IA]|nr:hypothetical protein AG1IA_10283 [Rhizoctonia solani AG-1 IA]